MDKILGIMRDGTDVSNLSTNTEKLRSNLEAMSEARSAGHERRLRGENRVLARRLQTLAPNYPRAGHLADYERSCGYQRTISRAHRLRKHLSTTMLPSTEMTLRLKTFDDIDMSEEALKTPGLELRTARQVRADTANAHAYDLGPDLTRSTLSLRTPEGLPVTPYGERLRE